jgi:hypothetical protein
MMDEGEMNDIALELVHNHLQAGIQYIDVSEQVSEIADLGVLQQEVTDKVYKLTVKILAELEGYLS